MDAWSLFRELGAGIGRSWRAASCDPRAFAEVAHTALSAAAIHRELSFDALTSSMLTSEPMPTQTTLDEAFGEPPVCVYQGEAFYIEVLFWLDGLVAIHQHSFAGAFTVLHGSSIESCYRFTESERINAATRLGALELTSAELLEQGACRPIHASSQLIHSTFHLDRPTVSVVVRTRHDTESGPQLNYLRPGLAIDPFHQRTFALKRVQLLKMLHRCRPDQFWTAVDAVLADSDCALAFSLVHQLHERLGEAERERLIEAARRAHGQRIDALVPVLATEARKRLLTALRSKTEDAELRFFLALLLNVPDRRAILELVTRRFPGRDPVDTIVGWVARLTIEGQPIAVGDAWLALFRALVAGEREPQRIRTALGSHAACFANNYALLSEIQAMRGLGVFHSLLAGEVGSV